jgi:hypothetical protein
MRNCLWPQKVIRSEDDCSKFRYDLCYVEHIFNNILDAKESEVCNIKVDDVVVYNLESFNISLTASSSSVCPKLKTVKTVFAYNDTPSQKPQSCLCHESPSYGAGGFWVHNWSIFCWVFNFFHFVFIDHWCD